MISPSEQRAERDRRAAERRAKDDARKFTVWSGEWHWDGSFRIAEYDAILTAKLLKIYKPSIKHWYQYPASQLGTVYHSSQALALEAARNSALEKKLRAEKLFREAAVRCEQLEAMVLG